MKILVIGGTRLLGLSLVKRLLSTGYDVTVLSNRPEKCPAGAKCIGSERQDGLKSLAGQAFDFVFDFLAYDAKSVVDVLENINNCFYVLISSTWMIRLNSSASIYEPIKKIIRKDAEFLPEVTYKYLLGKMTAENTILRSRAEQRFAAILRLPIFFGEDEHTGRLDFYLQRVTDGSPIICVNGGHNIAQIAWSEDISRAMIEWMPFAKELPIWDGIPDEGTSVRELIRIIASGVLKDPTLIDIADNELIKEFPDYLLHEPFWREKQLTVGNGNIFMRLGIKPTKVANWICSINGKDLEPNDVLRNKEISYLKAFI